MDTDSGIRLSKAINGDMPSRLQYAKPNWADNQFVRTSGLVEDICKHGVGHPNLDWLEYHPDRPELGTHGCDGCCSQLNKVDNDNVNPTGDTMKNGDSL